MQKNDSLPTIWEIPDDLWELTEPILPPVKPPGTRGRPPSDRRRILNGILWVLRTGCQWKQVPPSIGAGSTLHDYHQAWTKAGVYEDLAGRMLEYYDSSVGIGFDWQSLDGCITKAPLGGAGTGRSPVDRGKSGTKRSLLVDRRGAPLSVEVDGANVPDMQMLADTLANILIERPEEQAEHLCLDKGYDTRACDSCCEEFGYIAHTRRRGEQEVWPSERTHQPKRWVVERTHSWYNRFRRLLIRWEKKLENYLGLIDFASSLIIYRIIKNHAPKQDGDVQ